MTVSMTPATTSSLVVLHAQTPLHPGAGTALGVVDLPVQRERHTRWPMIPGSSVKGVLRDAFRRGTSADLCSDIFGPETDQAEKHAGALSVTDARILAFPVRSLQGVFAYATAPAVLHRLRRDLALVGDIDVPLPEAALANGRVHAAADSPLLVDDRIVLEEFDLQVEPWDAFTTLARQLAAWISDDEPTRNDFARRLVLLDDNQFTHFVRHGTEVVARIGLDYERKTVRKGALFYQEFLPAETIMYSLVMAHAVRSDTECSAADVLQHLRQNTPAVLQFGGDETTGKGFCHVHFAQPDGKSQ